MRQIDSLGNTGFEALPVYELCHFYLPDRGEATVLKFLSKHFAQDTLMNNASFFRIQTGLTKKRLGTPWGNSQCHFCDDSSPAFYQSETDSNLGTWDKIQEKTFRQDQVYEFDPWDPCKGEKNSL